MDKIKESIERLAKLEGQAVNWFTKVVTVTPVFLTVLATVLAGLSSSEMTRSMYYRSLAAQHQAKAGDQWAYFQAKKMREALARAERERRPVSALPGPDSTLLTDHMDRLAKEVDRLVREVRQVRDRLPDGDAQLAARDLLGRAEPAARECSSQSGKLLQNPTRHEVFRPFARTEFLDHKQAPLEEPAIEEASRGLREHRPEAELQALLMRIPEEALRQAIITADTDAHAFEQIGDETQGRLNDVANPVKAALAQAGTLHQAVRAFETRVFFPQPPASVDEAIRKQIEPIQQADAAVRQEANELKEFWNAVQDTYTASRLRHEANDNRRLAEVLEVQVHKSSYQADRLHARSQWFFFGMLGAQAGVVISSMAVAARRKSSLWLLASVAGLFALGFSSWVYLNF
jgi:hypothetical protein